MTFLYPTPLLVSNRRFGGKSERHSFPEIAVLRQHDPLGYSAAPSFPQTKHTDQLVFKIRIDSDVKPI